MGEQRYEIRFGERNSVGACFLYLRDGGFCAKKMILDGDTNIIGSNVKGNQVNADVGGNLNIVSVQDTLSSAAHQSSSGGGFSISQGGASASFSQSKGNASGSYAGVNEQGRGLAPDYMTVNVGALSGNVSGTVNLYDGSTYVSGGVSMTNPSSVSYRPGVSSTIGYILGADTVTKAGNFLTGDGNQAFISVPTPFGVNVIGAITHAYGGSTAVEFGIGQPGSISFGVMPWGHSSEVTGHGK